MKVYNIHSHWALWILELSHSAAPPQRYPFIFGAGEISEYIPADCSYFTHWPFTALRTGSSALSRTLHAALPTQAATQDIALPLSTVSSSWSFGTRVINSTINLKSGVHTQIVHSSYETELNQLHRLLCEGEVHILSCMYLLKVEIWAEVFQLVI